MAETMGHREDFNQSGSFAYYIWLIFFVVISGDRSLPGIGSLLNYFWAVKGDVRRKNSESFAF